MRAHTIDRMLCGEGLGKKTLTGNGSIVLSLRGRMIGSDFMLCGLFIFRSIFLINLILLPLQPHIWTRFYVIKKSNIIRFSTHKSMPKFFVGISLEAQGTNMRKKRCLRN